MSLVFSLSLPLLPPPLLSLASHCPLGFCVGCAGLRPYRVCCAVLATRAACCPPHSLSLALFLSVDLHSILHFCAPKVSQPEEGDDEAELLLDDDPESCLLLDTTNVPLIVTVAQVCVCV